uniref:Uncharacterized protein n=1 Tax=viral metagenome TaxID=1070528 RepID=A0A6C0KXL6_9ZZZZ
MTTYSKNAHGHYMIKGKKYEILIGSRAQVYHGTAYKTSGGLKKDNIMMNKNGRIVSKAKHNTAKKEKRLIKAGYGTKKGKFGFVMIGSRKAKGSKKHGRSRRQRGGKGVYGGQLNPEMVGSDMQQQQ